MFQSIKKWFFSQVGQIYQEIMVIKKHQIDLEEKIEDYHAELMASQDDLRDTLEEMQNTYEYKNKRSESRTSRKKETGS